METRDLEQDLAICEAATPGPWIVVGDRTVATRKTDRDGWHDSIIHARTPIPIKSNLQLMAAARSGWPYAIRRALSAEAEIDRLRNELQILQEQLSQRSNH